MNQALNWLNILIGATIAMTEPATASPGAQRPNVVLMMADDMGYECLSSNGSLSYKTPRLDAIAGQSVRFEHCYSTPLCTPSRVQIMTGQYNFRNYEAFGYLNPNQRTFGQVMRDSCYATAIAGKWQLNGLTYKLPGFEDSARPIAAGFDEYCLWQLTKPRKEGERYWDPLIERNGQVLQDELKGQYGPDVFCDFVLDFIERKKDEPFFVYYPMVLTHDPFVPTPHSADRGEKDKHKNFADMVAYTDTIVGRVHDKLDELGLLENTILIFTADNGTNVAITSETREGEVKGGKGSTPNAGTHVPMVAYWKGHTPNGKTSLDLVDFTDILPTLAETAGVDLGDEIPVDGRSFLPQLRGERGNPRDWVFCHYDPMWGRLSERKTRFARTERFKLYHDGRFYDVPADVLEKNNIDITQGAEIELKAAEREKLQAVLDSFPPWAPRTAMARPSD
jgi:arylsulfatase A